MRLRALLAAALLALVVAAPASAAKPERFVIDIATDPDFEAGTEEFLAFACGFDVEVDARGHIIILLFDRANGNGKVVELDVYNMHQTFTANGRSVTIPVDAGPDVVFVGADGQLRVAITGHPTGGSGLAGRTVVNLETGEVEQESGHFIGDWVAMVCEGLAPA